MLREDYYALLGICQRATHAEIRRAYHMRVRECHPDLHPEIPDASARLKHVIEAYRALYDPMTRQSYDRVLDLYRTPRTETTRPRVPRTVSQRKSAALKAFLITLVLAVGSISAVVSMHDNRPVPLEWTQGQFAVAQVRCSDLTAEEVEANLQWALWFWEKETQFKPMNRFAALKLAETYRQLARHAGVRGNRALAHAYRLKANKLNPLAVWLNCRPKVVAKS